jgi:hypothetical protein
MLSTLSAGKASKADADISAMFSRFAAQQSKAEAGIAANGARIEATQEYLIGQSRVLELKRRLFDDLGANSVAYAASGVDPTSGSAATRADALQRVAGQDIRLEEANAEIKRAQALLKASAIRRGNNTETFGLNMQAANSEARGQAALDAAGFEALGTGLQFGADVLKRGGPGGGLGSWAAIAG